MERKNYLVEKLSKEEKLYLKRMVMSVKDKYIKKNNLCINNQSLDIDNIIVSVGDTIIDEIIKNCEADIESAIEFEQTFNNPKLIKIIGALPLKERQVLFYLHKKNKTLIEIGKLLNHDPKTIGRIRDRAYKKIAEKLINGGYKYV